jgi:hypothetical protein
MRVRVKDTGKIVTVNRVTSKFYVGGGEVYIESDFEVASFWVRVKAFFSQFGWLRHAR